MLPCSKWKLSACGFLFSKLELNLITTQEWECPRRIIEGIFCVASFRIVRAVYIFL